ncbi:MAG TPA: hypothetical protein VE868_02280 [Balneolaceae bacterium]|nr:hypothetical protein [Balneolaceae bacterium]
MRKNIKETRFYRFARKYVVKAKNYKQMLDWLNEGLSGPPPLLVKQKILKAYARDYDLKLFVQTATFRGDMVEALRKKFKYLYSIEMNEAPYLKATMRFQDHNNVKIIRGNAAEVLKELMKYIKKPTLFWLNRPYSNGSTLHEKTDMPILQELKGILSDGIRRNVILIDEARYFGTAPSYPDLQEVKELCKSLEENLDIHVEHDLIRITPDCK